MSLTLPCFGSALAGLAGGAIGIATGNCQGSRCSPPRTGHVRLSMSPQAGVQRIVALNGGIAPARRRRAVAALKLEEREEISREIAAGRSVRRIARGLKRSPSTISREIRRNGGSQTYRANRAERSA